MGTSIKISAYKGTDTPDEVWKKFVDKFYEVFDDVDDWEEGVTADPVYCSYSSAYLEVQMSDFEEFKGNDIEVCLWYLETDPDETMEL